MLIATFVTLLCESKNGSQFGHFLLTMQLPQSNLPDDRTSAFRFSTCGIVETKRTRDSATREQTMIILYSTSGRAMRSV